MIHNVARILELVVPLMEHPSETFLASLEEDLMRLTVKHGQTVGLNTSGVLLLLFVQVKIMLWAVPSISIYQKYITST